MLLTCHTGCSDPSPRGSDCHLCQHPNIGSALPDYPSVRMHNHWDVSGDQISLDCMGPGDHTTLIKLLICVLILYILLAP